ncbi:MULTISPECIES: universal stress protein [Pseudonocardia]|jgi:nucleotide-binding universal stress UspA family protein|uniref:Universal stress protein n=1 Tax=Pseudonocardia abyssalis TaxID=2792008 RepID=A0ABS6V0D5_9PSEU|nr:universal stress protein [Pseudonocardia abyssalis]MBW0118937.1 universal stress protein [Pseudonocardia abyssalis]MBW0137979.1 universal stress protein [Pseudonocardia abyssalis]
MSDRVQLQAAAGPAAGHLVVGHDRSASAGRALEVAVDLARRLGGAAVHVVHGVDLDDYPIDPDSADWDQQAARALEEQRRAVRDVAGGALGGWSYHAGRGDPADLLVALAQEVDALMIVVGTQGEGVSAVFERVLDRSVSHAVIHRQHRPVLVVPPS